jgi:hypothetical protein
MKYDEQSGSRMTPATWQSAPQMQIFITAYEKS